MTTGTVIVSAVDAVDGSSIDIWDFDEAEIVNVVTGLAAGSSDALRGKVEAGIAVTFAGGWRLDGKGLYSPVGTGKSKRAAAALKLTAPHVGCASRTPEERTAVPVGRLINPNHSNVCLRNSSIARIKWDIEPNFEGSNIYTFAHQWLASHRTPQKPFFSDWQGQDRFRERNRNRRPEPARPSPRNRPRRSAASAHRRPYADAAVLGSIFFGTSTIRFAGKPLISACLRMTSSFLAK